MGNSTGSFDLDSIAEQDPTRDYGLMSWGHVKNLTIADGNAQVSSGKIRIVCISDTHNRAEELQVPDGDVLIHAGDFSSRGGLEDILRFNKFLSKLPHKHKIVIAGNHELSFGYYDSFTSEIPEKPFYDELVARGLTHPSQLLENCIYLKDSSVTLYGLKFYGSPWQPFYGGWAYNAHRGKEIKRIWENIPCDTDVLITHGPPLGIGDVTYNGIRLGCTDLYKTVSQRVKPKLHVFGHIHEGYGLYSDGTTIYANAASCRMYGEPLNLPICVDIPLPVAGKNPRKNT